MMPHGLHVRQTVANVRSSSSTQNIFLVQKNTQKAKSRTANYCFKFMLHGVVHNPTKYFYEFHFNIILHLDLPKRFLIYKIMYVGLLIITEFKLHASPT